MVTFTGVECHNKWEITFEEIRRNGTTAYTIYNHVSYTGDEDYLRDAGLEVLVTVARFWADRVHFSQRRKQCMIHSVTGPSEYEDNINDDWYTNTIAAWVLHYTRESYLKFQEETTLKIADDKLTRWVDIVENMYFPADNELDVFVQHDTFLDKDLMPVSNLSLSELPLDQHWSWDRILRSCFTKQADILQRIYFFNDAFSLEEERRNLNFYEPMTVHESSPSPGIHAVLAVELDMGEKAVEIYRRTTRLDLDSYNNDTEDGLHITSVTGSWLAIVQGFTQTKTDYQQLKFAPFLPATWTAYSFRINYRNRLLFVEVAADQVTFTLLDGPAISLTVYNRRYTLKDRLVLPIRKEEVHV